MDGTVFRGQSSGGGGEGEEGVVGRGVLVDGEDGVELVVVGLATDW